MVTTIAKRIQSKLSRNGLKVSLGDIRSIYNQMVADIENPTDVEVNNIFEHFMSTATRLTVIQEDVEPMTSNETATELETLTNNNSEELETLRETSICVGGETGNIQPTITEQVETTELSTPVNNVDNLTTGNSSYPAPSATTTEEVGASALAPATKTELVASTAGSLGIVLNTAEIELIAENVNHSSDDLTDSLEEIKTAIIAFVRHKIALNSQKIGETLEEITQVATDGFNQNSEQLTTGLQQINQQLQQQSQDFKSQVKATLSAFRLPAAS